MESYDSFEKRRGTLYVIFFILRNLPCMVPSSLEAEVSPRVRCLPHTLRAALDKRLRSRVQWNRAVLLAESQKLEPWPLDEDPRPKSGKSRLNLHGIILERFNQLRPPKEKKKILKGELMIWRTKMQTRVQGKVQLKDSICFKWVHIGS
jgi:hypothetical protein